MRHTMVCLIAQESYFSSNGAYFATASMDFAARLWCFERSRPLRIFADHPTGVDVCIL